MGKCIASGYSQKEITVCNTCFHVEVCGNKDYLTENKCCNFAESPLTEPKPLSLDELRGRNGKPVWIKLYDTVTCRVLHLYKRHEMDWGRRFAFTDGSELWENQYKLTWTAYDRPPRMEENV